MYRKLADPQRDVDVEIGHIRGLVLIRRLLAERGATPAELHACDAVIAESRRQLADLALLAGAYASAAA
ncbi:MAG TPA: hypothetical protein VN770_00360 [Gaiellaceae bacterium]|nr:hypothetical protein [Gaiellaceae bacterium]